MRDRGFTLLELLVVIAIMALATAGVALSLRDSSGNALDREAQRLESLLEAGRAQSRASGVALRWRLAPGGFALESAGPRWANEAPADPGDDLLRSRPWLATGLHATIEQPAGATAVLLGPEPLVPPQVIALRLDDRVLRVGTDGFRPFHTLDVAGAAP